MGMFVFRTNMVSVCQSGCSGASSVVAKLLIALWKLSQKKWKPSWVAFPLTGILPLVWCNFFYEAAQHYSFTLNTFLLGISEHNAFQVTTPSCSPGAQIRWWNQKSKRVSGATETKSGRIASVGKQHIIAALCVGYSSKSVWCFSEEKGRCFWSPAFGRHTLLWIQHWFLLMATASMLAISPAKHRSVPRKEI